jgi:hypothetical protein
VNGVIQNDGEVAVLIRFSTEHWKWVYRRAWTKRRGSMTREEFQRRYEVVNGADEITAFMLETLGITQKEMDDALRKARSDNAERHYLLELVRANRKKSHEGSVCPVVTRIHPTRSIAQFCAPQHRDGNQLSEAGAAAFGARARFCRDTRRGLNPQVPSLGRPTWSPNSP